MMISDGWFCATPNIGCQTSAELDTSVQPRSSTAVYLVTDRKGCPAGSSPVAGTQGPVGRLPRRSRLRRPKVPSDLCGSAGRRVGGGDRAASERIRRRHPEGRTFRTVLL